MQLIAITPPDFLEHEVSLCNRLFEKGLEILHLRKPNATEIELKTFLDSIHTSYLSRIVIHGHYHLAEKYNLKGIHLKFRERENISCYSNIRHISISCHSITELSQIGFTPAYSFLSPVFDSISKKGYKGFTEIPDLRINAYDFPVIALGGISPEKLPSIVAKGFQGVAVLGWLWENTQETIAAFTRLKAISDMLSSRHTFQYITDYKKDTTEEKQVENTCKGGIRWVQLRMKNATSGEITEKAEKIREICNTYNTLFIINDNVEIALRTVADGVHLGKEDISPSQARRILGTTKIIGATCNTLEDIVKAVEQGADYIGLGPYRFTTTKKKLSPILGLEGYLKILRQMKENGIHIPIYAIGGITEDDILPILNTGVNGIALSGLIKNSNNMEAKTTELLRLSSEKQPD